jgi:type IV secretion system protein VirB11
MRTSEEARRHIIRLLGDLIGEQIMVMLTRNTVNDVSCNPDGSVFVKVKNERTKLDMTVDWEKSAQIVSYVADLMGRSADDTSAIVEAPLRFLNARFVGGMPPHTDKPWWHIRSHARESFTLQSYLDTGRCSEHSMNAIDMAMDLRMNVAVIGPTGSGKTGFLDALGGHPKRAKERTIVIEEIPEVKMCGVGNKVLMTADPRRIWHGHNDQARFRLVSEEMNRLVRAALLADPDCIMMGEVRGGEFLELLKAIYSGHGSSMFTGHADHPVDFLHRAEMMLAEAVADSRAYRNMLCRAIHRIVLVRRDSDRGSGNVVGVYQPIGYNEATGTYVVSTLAGKSHLDF